jgi:putative methyltransferase (TIGR04325 family)
MRGLSLRAIKKFTKVLFPLIATNLWGAGWRTVFGAQSGMEYAPNSWKTSQSGEEWKGWNVERIVNAKKAHWNEFCEKVQGTGPLVYSPESVDVIDSRKVSIHNVYMTYAYVLALAAHRKTHVSVLDYGGGVGHFYQIGLTLLPDVTLEFHCKEVFLMAEAGKGLNPNIRWHTDDSFSEESFDLVMINASLQYIWGWQDALQHLARAVKSGGYFFLTRLPVVKGPSFAAIQRMCDTKMVHWQLNEDAVLHLVARTGLRLIREVFVGDRPYIRRAPEQCELKGWLFKRETP